MKEQPEFLEKKEKIANEFLEVLKYNKCNKFSLLCAASNLEITGGEFDILFKGGLVEVIEFLFQRHLDEIKIHQTEKISERVKSGVLNSFEVLTPYKKPLRKIVRFLCLPQNIFLLPKFSYKISDCIWRKSGISDSGFSFYTKRFTLMAIYSSCFTYFILSAQNKKLKEILEKELSLLNKISRKFKGN
jgi:ubiquinone biosynthesis protein COQ9